MLTYFSCPAHVLTLLRGKPYPFMVLSYLMLHRSTSTNNTYFMSLPRLTKIVGISQRETYNAIDVLKDLGLIEELANRKGERMFHLPFLVSDNVSENSENAESSERGSVTIEYEMPTPDHPTAEQIKSMSSEELEAYWDKEYGTKGGPQIASSTH